MNFLKQLKPFEINKITCLILAGLILVTSFTFATVPNSFAQSGKNQVNVYLFWGEGCPHCAKADQLIKSYQQADPTIDFFPFEVYYSLTNQQFLQSVADTLDIKASGVPLIVIGDKAWIGFSETTGQEVKQRLDECAYQICPDSVAKIVGVSQHEAEDFRFRIGSDQSKPALISLPLIGQINPNRFSLPLLTVIIGLLDGFNPCAMWALIFIISLLIGMHDRRRMWLYGTTFIVVSAAVYFAFMVAWLNLFLFIGQINWVRMIIGVSALAVGAYYLHDWYQHRSGCKITASKHRQQVFEKLRLIIKQKSLWMGLLGVIVLAAAVNLVELACSAGLPVLYTGVLSAAGLATWQYYAYMLFYVFFFMLDDLVVFSIAMLTLKITGIESKYTRAIRLVGGVLMIVLGGLLIFAPEVLMFG